MPIKWTKARRKKLNGVRTPHRTDPTDRVFDGERAFAWLRDRFRTCSAWTTIDATPRFQPVLDRLIGGYGDGGQPPTTLDPELEALRMAVAQIGHRVGETYPAADGMRALCGLWLSIGGAPAALTMYRHIAPFALNGSFTTESVALHVQPGRAGSHTDWAIALSDTYLEGPFWPALRTQVFGMDDKSYAVAMAAVAPLRDGLDRTDEADMRLRSRLDFVFSREPNWAAEDVRFMLDLREAGQGATTGDGHLLLAGLTDPDQAERFARSWGAVFAVDFVPYVHDLVEGLGPAAAGVLETVLERGQRFRFPAPMKKKLAAGITLARSG